MKYFHYCFYVDGVIQAGDFWSSSTHYVRQMILRVNPTATDISIWSAY